MPNSPVLTELCDEWTETVEEVKLAKITLAENENSYKCNSCTAYIVLFSTIFTINIGIVTYVYSQCYTKKDAPHVNFNTTIF